MEEPGVDPGGLGHRIHRYTDLESVLELKDPLRGRGAHRRKHRLTIDVLQAIVSRRSAHTPPDPIGFQPTQALLKGFFERAANGHHFAYRLHLRGEGGVRGRKLLEGKPRDLHHHVVQPRLEWRWSRSGDVVR